MSATVKQLDPTQVELEIEITSEELTRAQDAAFRKLVRNAKVPGFRPGKVPRKIFENTYGKEAIEQRALEDLVPDKYAEAVKEHAIEVLAQPEFEPLPQEEGGPKRFRAVVAVRPPIDPGPYDGIEITDQSERADDADVERALERLRKSAATLVPVERPLQLGDVAMLDYVGTVAGEPFEGGTASGQSVEVAEERFIPGFVAGVLGMSAGETREFPVSFPADYGQGELAGKDASFRVTLHEVKEPELPPLDDELAKRVSDHQTIEELTAELRRRLDAVAGQKARRVMSGELLEKLVAANDFPLPQPVVEHEIDNLLADSRLYTARAGIEWQKYLEQTGKTEDEIRADYRPEAERRVKTTLLVQEIAKREKIEATPADIEAELEALSRQYEQPREKILELLGRNAASLVDGIVRTKTIDRLIERAKRVPATKAE